MTNISNTYFSKSVFSSISASSSSDQQSSAPPEGTRSYRPLVKDVMNDSGFDLSKVKTEIGAEKTTTIAPPSYFQRRIPAPEPSRPGMLSEVIIIHYVCEH